MNKLVDNPSYQLPANPEAQNIQRAAQEDAGLGKMLKFKKGEYVCDGEVIALGSQYTAHAIGWTKCWIKFKNQQVEERKVYRMSTLDRVPMREDLDERDESKWEEGIDGRPADPWVLQFLLPMEDATGEINIFVTSSFGGKRAVADLCAAWGRKAAKEQGCGQPIVLIETVKMPTKKFGDVPRPYFNIIGWDGAAAPVRDVKTETLKQELDDEIPF